MAKDKTRVTNHRTEAGKLRWLSMAAPLTFS